MHVRCARGEDLDGALPVVLSLFLANFARVRKLTHAAHGRELEQMRRGLVDHGADAGAGAVGDGAGALPCAPLRVLALGGIEERARRRCRR
jgi:hypothetical protein